MEAKVEERGFDMSVLDGNVRFLVKMAPWKLEVITLSIWPGMDDMEGGFWLQRLPWFQVFGPGGLSYGERATGGLAGSQRT